MTIIPNDSENPTTDMPRRDIYTVSRLNREVRGVLEGEFPLLWLEGEISNLARPSSGHLYFSLKDERAQVRCAMFRGRNQQLGFSPANGLQVLIRARVGLYEPRGEFQLVAESMQEAGDGALRRAFEALKQRLQAEGLFEAERKRALPALPACIGVVTSPSGAAVRDIINVLGRRFPGIPVLIYPVAVQGAAAAAEIARAIRLASQRKDCDVLIVGRGGGSLEDLWAFNEEVVARAIHACAIPVVSAVGHEVDFTIADFVADLRAPTPSAAAELVTPDGEAWLTRFKNYQVRLSGLMQKRLADDRRGLDWLDRRLGQQHPGARLRQQAQRLDELEQRARLALGHHQAHARGRWAELHARLQQHSPAQRLAQLHTRNTTLNQRLHNGLQHRLEHHRQQLAGLSRALHAVSPLATLERGYAIISRRKDGGILQNAAEVKAGERIQARLARGQLSCTVDEVVETDTLGCSLIEKAPA